MQHGMGLHRYTGTAPMMPFAPWRGMVPPGYCRKCGQPSGDCCCGCRECRKEAKELVVAPDTLQRGVGDTGITALNLIRSIKSSSVQEQQAAGGSTGSGTAFIGGGCCVTLAAEYAPTTTTPAFAVVVLVGDSEGTGLMWGREEPVGAGYRVHECIITTKPGATLTVVTLNCTARVRWCEVFSC